MVLDNLLGFFETVLWGLRRVGGGRRVAPLSADKPDLTHVTSCVFDENFLPGQMLRAGGANCEKSCGQPAKYSKNRSLGASPGPQF